MLLQNASQQVLNSYPVIILSGDIDFKQEEIQRYREYVKQGGTLVLNTAYLSSFPEYQATGNQYQITDEKGKVIVYGDDYSITNLPNILTQLNSTLIPFRINGDVQYLMNVKDGSLVLTIINNNGVKKPIEGLEIIDYSKTQNVEIEYTGNSCVLEVRDWITGKRCKTDKLQTISLDPGDIAVLEFVI